MKFQTTSETNSTTVYKIWWTRPPPSSTREHLQPHPSNHANVSLEKIVQIWLKVFLLKVFLLVVLRSAFGMPLSEGQISALKNGATSIAIQTENPKKAGSKAWERFEKYKHATTIAEAMGNSANWQDLSGDFEKGYMKIVDAGDEPMTASTKRSAPEGTPDREAQARAKFQPTQLVPQVLVPEVLDPINKVEMSAATIAALRSMMREEFKHGMAEMETILASKIENSVGELRKEIASERDARQHLEERISHLEQKHLNPNMPDSEEDVVDKSMVVIGGFAADALEDAEKIVQDMLAGVDGFRDVDMAGSKQDIALASFDTPQKAMQFIRGQRTNPVMRSHTLWAAENRSRSERMRCKVVSKIKKFMIEIGGVEAKDIKVNYKLFKVNARVSGRNLLVASVNGNGELSWLHDNVPGAPVREAVESFMEEME